MDADTPIGAIKEEIARFSAEREWAPFHTPKNLAMALAAEAAELMEPFLWADDGGASVLAQARKREAVAEELADIVIYALQFANRTGIDVSEAVAAKLRRNAEKYPVEKSRGRSTKYTEL